LCGQEYIRSEDASNAANIKYSGNVTPFTVADYKMLRLSDGTYSEFFTCDMVMTLDMTP
jgi:predicted ATP-grasp superfamily ATP-dependent carboligase